MKFRFFVYEVENGHKILITGWETARNAHEMVVFINDILKPFWKYCVRILMQ